MVQHFHQTSDFRLAHLLVRAQLFPLTAHLLGNQGGENDHRDGLELGIILDHLSQAMAIHLGHLNVGDDQGHLFPQVFRVAVLLQTVPKLQAIHTHGYVHVAGLVQGFHNHPAQEDGVLRHHDGCLPAFPVAKALDL